MSIPGVRKAREEEWDQLRNEGKDGFWNERLVRERRDVEREAREAGITVHFGRGHELCYLANSELPESDPRRKYKGRAVFLGDQVEDPDRNLPLFQELDRAPATMAASKIADCHGLLPGNVLETADATSA